MFFCESFSADFSTSYRNKPVPAISRLLWRTKRMETQAIPVGKSGPAGESLACRAGFVVVIPFHHSFSLLGPKSSLDSASLLAPLPGDYPLSSGRGAGAGDVLP
jgi:hypothetical protein